MTGLEQMYGAAVPQCPTRERSAPFYLPLQSSHSQERPLNLATWLELKHLMW